MDVTKTRPTTHNNTTLLLFPILSLFLSFFCILILGIFHKDKLVIVVTQWPLLCVVLLGALALAIVVIAAAARATMVTWITVLLLLSFAGNRRRVLAKRGWTITNDMAMFLVGVLVKERSSLVALACATVLGFMAVICIKECHLISL